MQEGIYCQISTTTLKQYTKHKKNIWYPVLSPAQQSPIQGKFCITYLLGFGIIIYSSLADNSNLAIPD